MEATKKEVLKKIGMSTVLALSLFCLTPRLVKGAEGEGIGFSYHNRTPDNQMSDGNYFDLLVKPKQTQTLITEVRNESETPITLKVSINDAKTNESGIIEYGPSTLKSLAKNELQLSQIMTGPTEVKLKKGEVKELAFELKPPKKSFDGVILGGVQLEKIADQAEAETSFSIENKYAYVFSVSLRANPAVQPYQLSGGASRYTTKNERETVIVSVNNDSQEIVKELELTTMITKKGSDKVLAGSKAEGMKMAPKSILEYPIDFPDEEPGLYQTTTLVRVNQEEWVWEEGFEIKGTKETEAKDPPKAQTRKRQALAGSLIVLGSGGLVMLGMKKGKERQ